MPSDHEGLAYDVKLRVIRQGGGDVRRKNTRGQPRRRMIMLAMDAYAFRASKQKTGAN